MTTSDDLRQQVDTLEANLPGLQSILAEASLNAASDPDNPDAQSAVDHAGTALRAAEERLRGLKGAVDLAERQEAEQAEAEAEAGRQAERDALVAEQEAIEDRQLKINGAIEEIETELGAAMVDLAAAQQRVAGLRATLAQHRSNFDVLEAEWITLDDMIEAMPVTAEEVRAKADAEAAEAQAAADEEEAAEQARIAGEEVIEAVPRGGELWQMPDVGGKRQPARVKTGKSGVRMPRRDIPAWQAEQTKLAAMAEGIL